MREADLQATILDAAHLFGWIVQHNADSRRAHAGWPDLVLGHPHRSEVLIWELKTEKGRVTREQGIWLTLLAESGYEARMIRPDDLEWAIDRLQHPRPCWGKPDAEKGRQRE